MLTRVVQSRAPAAGEVVCGYKLLRELGARPVPTYAALAPSKDAHRDKDALVVAERLTRAGSVTTNDTASFVRDARHVMLLNHPNVTRLRDVAVAAEDVLVVSELVDGVTYAEMVEAANARGAPMPLVTHLRILVDVLQGLSAIHELRDAKRAPLGLLHGELSPENVVIGLDGAARLSHLCRVPSLAGKPSAGAAGYLAPELLLGDQSADPRADVYGVGVMLWEALAGARMHDDPNAGTIVLRLLGGKIEPPRVPADAPWASALVSAAMRAIAPDPAMRFATAAEMTGEIRRAAGAKLAPKAVVAGLVESSSGARVRARRAALVELAMARPAVTAPRPARAPAAPVAPSTAPAAPAAPASPSRAPAPPAAAPLSAFSRETVPAPLPLSPARPPLGSRPTAPGPAPTRPSVHARPTVASPMPMPARENVAARPAAPSPIAAREAIPIPIPAYAARESVVPPFPDRASSPPSDRATPLMPLPSGFETRSDDDLVEVIEMDVSPDAADAPAEPHLPIAQVHPVRSSAPPARPPSPAASSVPTPFVAMMVPGLAVPPAPITQPSPVADAPPAVSAPPPAAIAIAPSAVSSPEPAPREAVVASSAFASPLAEPSPRFTPTPHPTTDGAMRGLSQPPPRSRARVVGIAAASLLLLAGGAFALLASSSDTSTAIATPHVASEPARTGAALVDQEPAAASPPPASPAPSDDSEASPEVAAPPTPSSPSAAPPATRTKKPRYDPMGI